MADSHLWINGGSEHWVFNERIREEIADPYKADSVAVGYFDPNIPHNIVFENPAAESGVSCVIIQYVPSPGSLGWVRGFGGYYWGLVYFHSRGIAWTGVTGNRHYRPAVYGVKPTCSPPGESPKELRIYGVETGHLLLKRPWLVTDSYRIKLEDRCPPGYKQVGGNCVWEKKDAVGSPLPSDHDNDPNTRRRCPYGYIRFFDRCLRIPGWDYRDPNNPKPPDIFLPPFGDDRRPPDPEGRCPPGYERWLPPRGRVQCRKKCPPGETRDPKTGRCCCAGIPGVASGIKELTQEIRGIRRELL